MFEPVTWYTLLLALAADYASKDRRAAREARRMVRRPNPPPPVREALPPPRTFPERSPTA
jgi:hypothetical protein